MALIDPTAPVFDPARFARDDHDAGDAIPSAALARLSALRGEASHNMHLLQFLARSPQACLCLMLAGAAALIWASQGESTLQNEFFWVLSVLIGVVAVTGNYIRSYARSARRVPLHKAATDLRLLLLYTGVAWGAGAFLVMPDLPAPALVIAFAAAPSLALTLLLQDHKGATAFTAPVTLATASAAMLESFDLWLAAAILAAGILIFCLPMLQREIAARRDSLPVPTLR